MISILDSFKRREFLLRTEYVSSSYISDFGVPQFFNSSIDLVVCQQLYYALKCLLYRKRKILMEFLNLSK